MLASGNEILTPEQMAEADRLAVESGVPLAQLMENAGRAAADAICDRFGHRDVAVLCGPGNNGGDGYAAARLLRERGWPVTVYRYGDHSALKEPAAAMARRWQGDVKSFDGFEGAGLIIDAIFGAGLSRPLEDDLAMIAMGLRGAGPKDRPLVVAIDVPSGIRGDASGAPETPCFSADLTVTFFRKKPAHVLQPWRARCGEIVIADIGIPARVVSNLSPSLWATLHGEGPAPVFTSDSENVPAAWVKALRWPTATANKYTRGHTIVLSGPPWATGAARLAAMAALRAGSGLVTLASPTPALPINAAHLTSILLRPCDGPEQIGEIMSDRRINTILLGPGLGLGETTRTMVQAAMGTPGACVIDADGISAFADQPRALWARAHNRCVFTPHTGEFERAFPGLLKTSINRIEAAREAARRAKAVIVLKGSDTVIANADGETRVNTNAPPSLATAGSGDVLAGIIAGLLAQGVPPFDAASAGVWLHGDAASRFGEGLIAEDLLQKLPESLNALRQDPGGRG